MLPLHWPQPGLQQAVLHSRDSAGLSGSRLCADLLPGDPEPRAACSPEESDTCGHVHFHVSSMA